MSSDPVLLDPLAPNVTLPPPPPIKPKIGGLLGGSSGGLFGVGGIPWTGGSPNRRWTASSLQYPASPFSFRTSDPERAMKIYDRSTRAVDPKLSHADGAVSLASFADDLLERTIECGLDSVLYVPSFDGSGMENILHYHSRHTRESVSEWVNSMTHPDPNDPDAPCFDFYDKQNIHVLKSLILNSLDATFRTYLRPQLEGAISGPEVWMIVVGELQSDSLRRIRKLERDLQEMSVRTYRGENIRHFVHDALVKCTELERAARLPPDVTLTLVSALTKSSVEEFRVHFMGKRGEIEKFLRTSAGKVPSVVARLPNQQTFRILLDDAAQTYQSLVDTDQWPPIHTAGDTTGAPSAFVSKVIDSATLIQLNPNYHSLKMPTTPSYTPNPGVTCFHCGQPGHVKTNCPGLISNTPVRNPPGWKLLAPTQNAPTTKIMNGKTYHWCAHCKSWRLSHGTEAHKNTETLNQERMISTTETNKVLFATPVSTEEPLENLDWTTDGAWNN
jgi:Zinc knuckle